jgi:hypothetical protein
MGFWEMAVGAAPEPWRKGGNKKPRVNEIEEMGV